MMSRKRKREEEEEEMITIAAALCSFLFYLFVFSHKKSIVRPFRVMIAACFRKKSNV